VVLDGFDLPGWIPVLLAAAGVEQEVFQNRQAAGRVRDFGMKLDGEQAARGRGDGRDGAVSVLARTSNRPAPGHDVAVAHPDLLAAFNAVEDRIGIRDVELSEPVLATVAFWTRPPSACAINCWRSRCEHGDAEVNSAGSIVGLEGRRRWPVRRR